MFRRTSLAIVAALGALLVAAPASAGNWGADRNDEGAVTTMLDARERSLEVKQAPDWIERLAAAHSMRAPVGDVRVRVDPADASAAVTLSSGRDIEWPQTGLGLLLALALAIGTFVALRPSTARPLIR